LISFPKIRSRGFPEQFLWKHKVSETTFKFPVEYAAQYSLFVGHAIAIIGTVDLSVRRLDGRDPGARHGLNSNRPLKQDSIIVIASGVIASARAPRKIQ
jgi:hypothetical protein